MFYHSTYAEYMIQELEGKEIQRTTLFTPFSIDPFLIINFSTKKNKILLSPQDWTRITKTTLLPSPQSPTETTAKPDTITTKLQRYNTVHSITEQYISHSHFLIPLISSLNSITIRNASTNQSNNKIGKRREKCIYEAYYGAYCNREGGGGLKSERRIRYKNTFELLKWRGGRRRWSDLLEPQIQIICFCFVLFVIIIIIYFIFNF